MKKTLFILLVNFLLYRSFAQQHRPSTTSALAVTHVNVIDVKDGTIHQDMTVLILDDSIAKINKSDSVKTTKGMQIINASGKYLLPGLWDMHVHLSWTSASALPTLVANGITNVRDMGGKLAEIDEWRTKIITGFLVGPEIVRAGPILNGKVFNQYQLEVKTPEEARAIVRTLKHVGVDMIKVHRRMPRDAYFAALDEAKKQGLPLVGHIPITVTDEEASDSGQVTIEHAETLFEGTFTAALNGRKLPDAIKQFRTDSAEKLFAIFKKNGTAVTPTLNALVAATLFFDGSFNRNPLKKYVAVSYKKEYEKMKVSREDVKALREVITEYKQVVGLLNRSGVLLLAGTDLAAVQIPGFSLHNELALLVESGLSPLQAIQTATINPAKVLNILDHAGTVDEGKKANLILLDANPLIDIYNTQKINSVILRGKLFDRKALDELLQDGERQALKN